MAGRGPAPKPDDQRRRRNAPSTAEIRLVDDGVVLGDPLPLGYPPEVVEWHETWRRSPQAKAFLATDWQRLRMLALVVSKFYLTGSKDLLAEIRQNEERLGATVVDRQRAKMTVSPDESGPAALAPVVDLFADVE